MKIYIKFPGGELNIEREPMKDERFYAVCYVLVALIAAAAFVTLIRLLVGR